MIIWPHPPSSGPHSPLVASSSIRTRGVATSLLGIQGGPDPCLSRISPGGHGVCVWVVYTLIRFVRTLKCGFLELRDISAASHRESGYGRVCCWTCMQTGRSTLACTAPLPPGKDSQHPRVQKYEDFCLTSPLSIIRPTPPLHYRGRTTALGSRGTPIPVKNPCYYGSRSRLFFL